MAYPTFTELVDEMLPPLASAMPEPPRPAPRRALGTGTPSRPVLGLPLARWIPQDVHSIGDYASAALAGSGATARDPRAQLASAVLAAAGLGVSAVTDYRLSLASWIPIETHEVIDYAWGFTAIAAPFALGYWRTSPRAALAHVIAGATTILSSLVTDYRAYSRRG